MNLSVSLCLSPPPPKKSIALSLLSNTESITSGRKEESFTEIFNKVFQGIKLLTPADLDKQTSAIRQYPYVVLNIYGEYSLYKSAFGLFSVVYTCITRGSGVWKDTYIIFRFQLGHKH